MGQHKIRKIGRELCKRKCRKSCKEKVLAATTDQEINSFVNDKIDPNAEILDPGNFAVCYKKCYIKKCKLYAMVITAECKQWSKECDKYCH